MKFSYAVVSAAVLLLAVPAWAQGSKLNEQDQTFIKTTLSANAAQVKLGQLAEHKAADPAVKELGRWMSADDGFANTRLQTIAQKSGGPTTPQLTEKDQSLEQQLKGAGGSQFDAQYVKAVEQAERKGIRQFKSEAEDGHDPMVRAYAKNLTPVLQQHLAEAEQLGGQMTASGSSVPPKH